jgi:linoleoyl-CoA desaturase
MSVQHDANHGAMSRYPNVNRVLRLTLDVMGVASSIWRQRHNALHHSYTNIQGVDADVDFGFIARLSPDQPLRPWHRFQHVYLWFLYGFLLPKWAFIDDFIILATRRIGPHRLPKMSRADLVQFVVTKIFFVSWSIVIPALYHPLWQVAVFHLIAVFTLGVTLSSVFQLAHCVEAAEFPLPAPAGQSMANDSALHQVETTVGFAHSNVFLTWYLGGLNFQVEHHLFPKVCHIHYPALARIVAEVATQHGVRYRANGTFRSAIASHFRFLRAMGQPEGVLRQPVSIPAGE